MESDDESYCSESTAISMKLESSAHSYDTLSPASEENDEMEVESDEESEAGDLKEFPIPMLSLKHDALQLNELLASRGTRCIVGDKKRSVEFVYVWLEVDLEMFLHLDSDRARAWNLAPSDSLYIKLGFHRASYYDKPPTVLAVVQAPPGTDMPSDVAVEGLTPPLSWYLKDRLRRSFEAAETWPPACLAARKSSLASLRLVESILELGGGFPITLIYETLDKRAAADASDAFELLEAAMATKFSDLDAAEANLARIAAGWSTNFLMLVCSTVEELVATASKRCLLCDAEVSETVRPTCCDAPFCVVRMEELGMGVNMESELLHNPEVVDLLICFCFDASLPGGRIDFLPPKSVTAVADDGTELSLMAAGVVDIRLLQKVIKLLPPVAAMAELVSRGELRAHLNSHHPLCYPLLKWIVASNRAYLRRAREEERVQGLAGVQFLLMMAPMEQERQFERLKAEVTSASKLLADQPDSFFAFHGSPFGNWHGILRTGLKNMSNTKYMTTGAAYGAGIYLAQDPNVSIGYAKPSGAGWPGSAFGPWSIALAVCEVVNSSAAVTSAASVQYFVAKVERAVVARVIVVMDRAVARIDSKLLSFDNMRRSLVKKKSTG